jgi:hypothetical protein
MARQKYHCDCEKRCKGILQEVGKTTYFTHKKYHDHFSKYSRSMQDFLNSYPIIVHGPSLRTAQSLSMGVGVGGVLDEPPISPSKKRA